MATITLLGKIVGLAFLLAAGVLMVILSCALYANAWPLLSVLCFLLAPLPNAVGRQWIARRAESSSSYLWSDQEDGGPSPLECVMDSFYFMTSCFIVSGLAIPMTLAHSSIIPIASMILCLSGGALIYLTIIGYAWAFARPTRADYV